MIGSPKLAFDKLPLICWIAQLLVAAQIGVLSANAESDVVHGTLIQFVDNGAWSWFQDERAIVDPQGGTLIVGSVANRDGIGGEEADGSVCTTLYDFATGKRKTYVHNDLESYGAGDDHNVPALLKKNDGNILAFYAAHNSLKGIEDDRSYYRTFDVKTHRWSEESEYHWWQAMPADAPGAGGTTYSNLFQLAADDADGDGHGRIYNIARVKQSPHLMYSDDNGRTWHYGGQLTRQASNPPTISYVNGYYKYTSNGFDRIDLLATEFHPRDYNNSVYHAYISRGKLHDSAGEVIDDDIFDAARSFTSAQVPSTDDFTRVFHSGKESHSRCWTIDVESYADGVLTVLFKTRAGGYQSHTVGADDHRFWFARFDPVTKRWSTHEIAKAGGQLFAGGETDYTGLGALHPNDPRTMYISTRIDPKSGAELAHHEIYKGVTADLGATWSWTAITESSSFDNLRPIVPAWDESNTAILWWRGTMDSSHDYDTAVVGILDRKGETTRRIRYVDATVANTTFADGTRLELTGPSTEPGMSDGRWHRRTGIGNKGDVIAADEIGGEDPPVIKSSISDLKAGTYDIFVFFWCDAEHDCRIAAGLSRDDQMTFRSRSSQQALPEHLSTELTTRSGTMGLYRAFLGRVNVDTGQRVDIYLNDDDRESHPVWFDGVGYSRVE